MKRAIDIAFKIAKEKRQGVYTLGPIIHNPQVVTKLREKGIVPIENIKTKKEIKALIIRTHGIPLSLSSEIVSRGYKIIDATCPFVKKAQYYAKLLSEENYQVVFSDTPGIINPAYELQESMMDFVKTAFEDADILVYMVETGEKGLKNEAFFKKIQSLKIPVLLLINKIDQSSQKDLEEQVAYWKEALPNAEIHPVSALEKFNMGTIMNRIVELLPESPPFYPKDQLTDKPERFFVNETIREKILLLFKKEIP